ncbi:sporulation protein YunB [Metabacillus herbersteinensis]|uniref:Sporulation protein YunB n=1 Tax=Metabacillus herbersteinensis TaxID=283816 RepID=A0ABV6GBH6_9BACI
MAKFRGRPPKRGPLPFRYVLLLSLVIFIFMTVGGLWYIEEQIEPTLMSIAELEATSIATLIIQEAVEGELFTDEEAASLYIEDKDNDGNINSTRYNTRVVNKALRRVTDNITKKLEEVEMGNFNTSDPGEPKKDIKENSGIIYDIPLGRATGNALLSTLGPKIPIRFYLIGDVHTDPKYKITEYGINNAIYEISIYTEVTVQIILPFATERATIHNTIPVIKDNIRGDVPLYFNESNDSSPSIQLPEKP